MPKPINASPNSTIRINRYRHLYQLLRFLFSCCLYHHIRQPQAKINAVYKQATVGDCCEDTTDCPTLFEKTVMTMWRGFKGTPAATAKRRFITLLRDVDARLLQIKAYQVTPWGFPTTAKGERICPYSNAKKGCPRPLVDKYGRSLELELDNKESLGNFTELRKWLDEVATQQQCSLGLHTPIAADKGARFTTFFAREECGGFRPYMSTGLHQMVKKVRESKNIMYAKGTTNNVA